MQLSFFSNDKNYDKINKNLKSILIRSNIFHILARTFFYIYIYIFCSTRSAYHYTSPLPFPPDITRNLFNEFFSFIGGWFLSFHLLFFALFNVPLGFPVIHCINFRLKRNHRLSGRYYTSVSLGDASKKRTNIPVGLAGAGRISRFHVVKLLSVYVCVCQEANELYIVISTDNFTRLRSQMPVNYWTWRIEREKLPTRNNFWQVIAVKFTTRRAISDWGRNLRGNETTRKAENQKRVSQVAEAEQFSTKALICKQILEYLWKNVRIERLESWLENSRFLS